mmetsp:Transcript_74680/g.136646  ORF Transcript_74680/g.136646 Transcript_74680/m.136646 type:complete len:86 (-) Transcript_74680:901-1158(-)
MSWNKTPLKVAGLANLKGFLRIGTIVFAIAGTSGSQTTGLHVAVPFSETKSSNPGKQEQEYAPSEAFGAAERSVQMPLPMPQGFP